MFQKLTFCLFLYYIIFIDTYFNFILLSHFHGVLPEDEVSDGVGENSIQEYKTGGGDGRSNRRGYKGRMFILDMDIGWGYQIGILDMNIGWGYRIELWNKKKGKKVWGRGEQGEMACLELLKGTRCFR